MSGQQTGGEGVRTLTSEADLAAADGDGGGRSGWVKSADSRRARNLADAAGTGSSIGAGDFMSESFAAAAEDAACGVDGAAPPDGVDGLGVDGACDDEW